MVKKVKDYKTEEDIKIMIKEGKIFSEYGKLVFDDEGKPICHICGESFDRLNIHIRQRHGLYVSDYKRCFGLNVSRSLISKEQKCIMRQHTMNNYDKVVTVNLIVKGEKTRFKNGSVGRIKEKIAPEEMARLKNEIYKTHVKVKEKNKEKNNESI